MKKVLPFPFPFERWTFKQHTTRIILSVLLNGLLIWFGARLLSGVYVDGYITAIFAGIILGLVNFFIKPIVAIR